MQPEEVERLFDLSTVLEDEADRYKIGKLRKRLITVNRPIFKGATVVVQSEKYATYEAVSPKDTNPALSLNLFKACGVLEQESGHTPCMPSLRLEMLEREYHEPVRDRDKNWVLESQRPIFNEKGKDIVSPRFALRLGKYRHDEVVSKQFWAAEYQTMLRECRLLRQAAIISDTNCIVEMY